jgi:hypothetical protein
MIEQFEEDNKFYLDQKTWNRIKDDGICLRCWKRDLNKANYKNIKKLIKKVRWT